MHRWILYGVGIKTRWFAYESIRLFHEAKNPGDDINDTCINSRQLINILKEPDTSLWMPDATENSCTGNIITDLSNNSELSKSGEKVNA